jgi:hypothetical protein
MTLRYDIWGPDVLVANLMESNGVPGRITVSEKTVEALQHVPGVQFQHLGHVDVCVYIDLIGRDSGSTWGSHTPPLPCGPTKIACVSVPVCVRYLQPTGQDLWRGPDVPCGLGGQHWHPDGLRPRDANEGSLPLLYVVKSAQDDTQVDLIVKTFYCLDMWTHTNKLTRLPFRFRTFVNEYVQSSLPCVQTGHRAAQGVDYN